ncbi:MAG: cyclodeaminase/cyclohydrolase family protein [Clostridiales bacterium]|nr:cyclodeaminase/cyclohydrolase family protein [Clostridiales bacterium]
MTDKSCTEFLLALSSSEPVPGGGGASAMTGAMGVALGSMVANLTSNKKKYENVQNDINRILKEAQALTQQLTDLVEKDAEAFEPLSKAYGLPKNTDDEKRIREETMEKALKTASEAPLLIMQKALEAINLHEELAKIGTKIAVSDVGVGVLFLKTAIMGASLNVFINTKLMKDRSYAEALNQKAKSIIAAGVEKADRVYREVEAALV